MGRMTLITGGERHRRWSDEDRFRILAAIEEPGAVVAEVARCADVCTSLVYKWRRQARLDRKSPSFAKVIVENDAPVGVQTSEAECGVIFVEMKEARVRICANASPALIASALKALRS